MLFVLFFLLSFRKGLDKMAGPSERERVLALLWPPSLFFFILFYFLTLHRDFSFRRSPRFIKQLLTATHAIRNYCFIFIYLITQQVSATCFRFFFKLQSLKESVANTILLQNFTFHYGMNELNVCK